MSYDHDRTKSLLAKLSRVLGKVSRDPRAERIHELRTSVRRTEALMKAYGLQEGHRKLAKELKRLRRGAGSVRDIDVQIAALETVKIGREANRKQQLLDHLKHQRGRRRHKLLDSMDKQTLAGLRKRLRTLEHEMEAMVSKPEGEALQLPHGKPPLTLALEEFASLVQEYGKLDAKNLHDFRTRCKRIRYTAEMAGEENKDAVEVVAELKRAQDAIGDWHDWDTLCATARENLPDPMNCALMAAIQNVTRAKFTGALRISESLKKRLVKRGEELAGPGKKPAAAESSASPPDVTEALA